MSKEIRLNHLSHSFSPAEVEGFSELMDLALDMRWSWNHAADELWHHLDPELWNLTQNPWAVLQKVSYKRLEQTLAEADLRKKVTDLLEAKKQAINAPAWFQQNYPVAPPLTCVAYFSMEFMLSEALPIYSGGLGNVAGDQLKAASDLGIPVIGIGLLYQQGYFRQVIGKSGIQQAFYPYNDPSQLPITPLRDANGDWLRLEVMLPSYSVWLRTWQVQVGRVKLYLLDSNDIANYPAHRGITSELYGGGPELRLKQELLLGIGGWRLLRALGIKPEVCHLNEGHAAFAVLERALQFMEETGQTFEAALAATRAGNLFTTHTAVPAGFDRFSPGLMEPYLGRYAQRLGITMQDLLALGRLNPNDASESFNMAYLAIRGSGAVNAVSRLHGEVSRRLFRPLFPHWPEAEVPVGYVTNGVHMPSWDSKAADVLWTEACGKDRWLGMKADLEAKIRGLSDGTLWQLRCANRKALIEFARGRLARDLAVAGVSPDMVDRARRLFDPNALTLGFARRFATYKRPNLLLHDPERLLRLLTNSRYPVQLIIAGKAHPADEAGVALIQQWMQFITRPEARPHVIFLSDYDMLLTEHLVQGVDVWINTPRRPWEASGTSGMKVLVNGGINLSELDGWWAEAYTPDVGWALGDRLEHDEDPAWDAAEAEQLYTLLEQEIAPEFYACDENGIPTAWVSRMRESMARLTPQFSANRAVREYTEKYYIPAATAYNKRSAENGAVGNEVYGWQRAIKQRWAMLRFGDSNAVTDGNQHVFEIQVYLDDLDPDMIEVELYAEGIHDEMPVVKKMERARPLAGAVKGYIYRARVSATRPAPDYTARVIPHYRGTAIPLEATEILWQR